MKKSTKVVLTLVLLLCTASIGIPLGISNYYEKYGEYYYKTLIVGKDDALLADDKVTDVKDCGDFSIVKYRSMKATGEAVSDLYAGNSKPFIIDTDMSLNAGLIEDVDASEVVERTELPAKSDDDIVVAVVDTGFDPEQSPYADRVVKGIDLTDTGEMTDQNGHGTLMTNTILQYSGQNVKVMPVKVMAGEGCRTSTLFEGMIAAVDSGADIVNVSMSSLFVESGDYSEQICAYAKSQNVPIVIAAGNNNMNTYSTVPANNYSGLVVAALDENGEKAGYSNNGDNVDVCSYGAVNVYNKYSCGTSVAAALVSSTLADNFEKGSTIEELEGLVNKLAEPMGGENEVVTYGNGLIIPKDFEPIHDEQSVIAESGKIYNLPWEQLDDVYLNTIILEKTSIYELRKWLDDLDEEQVDKLLERDTVLSQPYTLNEIEEEETKEETEAFIDLDKSREFDTYYDYIMSLDSDVVEPVCKTSPLIVKLVHKYEYDPRNGNKEENYHADNYLVYNGSLDGLKFMKKVGESDVYQSTQDTLDTGTTENKVFEQIASGFGAGHGSKWAKDREKVVTLYGTAFRLFCNAVPSTGEFSGLYHNRLTIVCGPTGTLLGGYANLKLNFTVREKVSSHSGAVTKTQKLYEGDFTDLIDSTTKVNCTGSKAYVENIGFSVGVCKSCHTDTGTWFKKTANGWKRCTGDDLSIHNGDVDGVCSRDAQTTIAGDNKNLGNEYKAKVYHVTAEGNKCCAFAVKGDTNMHGPFHAWTKTGNVWSFPEYIFKTHSNDISDAGGKAACTVTRRANATCKVCGDEVENYKIEPQGHRCQTNQPPKVSNESKDGDWADADSTKSLNNIKNDYCGRNIKNVENCSTNHLMYHHIKARFNYCTQGADGAPSTNSSDWAVADPWLCTWTCPELRAKGVVPSGPYNHLVMGAGDPIYKPLTLSSTYMDDAAAKSQSISGTVARNSYKLGISIVNDTPYPAEAGSNVATITGTATDQNYPSEGARPVQLGTVKHFCSGDTLGLNLDHVDNAISATCTPKKGYKFVGWYAGPSAETAELKTTSPTISINMPTSDYVLIAHVVGVRYNVRLYGNKLTTASSNIRNLNPNGFTYAVDTVNTAKGPEKVKPEDYITWTPGSANGFFYGAQFQVGNASCALPDVDKYCYKLPGYEAVQHTSTVYPNVDSDATKTESAPNAKQYIHHRDWCWYLYVGQDPATGAKGSEAANPFTDTQGVYENGIYKGCNDHFGTVQSWDLQLNEGGYANLFPVWTPIEYGVYYDKNTRNADDVTAGDGKLTDGAQGGFNPYTDSFEDVMMLYQYDSDYKYPENRWTRERGWGKSKFTGWNHKNSVLTPNGAQIANFKWEYEAGDDFSNLAPTCGTTFHQYAIFNDKPYVKAADIYDRNGNIAKLAEEMPGEPGKYVVSKSKLEEYILTMQQTKVLADEKNKFFKGYFPTYWWDRELGKFELGNFNEPDTVNAFGGKTRYWIEYLELEDMSNLSGSDKEFMDNNPDYIVIDPNDEDVATFEIHYSIQDEVKNYYTVTQKLYAGFWIKISTDIN